MLKIIWSRLPGNWVLKLIQLVILAFLIGLAGQLSIFLALAALTNYWGI